jgi:ketosteroid isomerase-like protein
MESSGSRRDTAWAMSDENVENFRRAVEAFNRGDADAFVALARPDVEWEDAVFWSEGSKVFRGRDELREWFAQVQEPWESIHIAVEEILEAGDDRMVVGLGLTARGGSSGAETRLQAWQVNWLIEGLTAKRSVFRDRDDALEAVGLSE